MKGLDCRGRPGRLAQRVARVEHDNVEPVPPDEVDRVRDLFRRLDGEAVALQKELGQP